MIKFLLVVLVLFSTFNASAKLRLASYNIRNFDYDVRSNTPTNKTHLVKIINEMRADLIAVQEINEKQEFERMINSQFKGTYETSLSDCGGAHGQKLGFIYNTSKLELIKFKEDLRTVNPKQSNQSYQSLCNSGSRPLAIAIFKKLDTNEKIVAISLHLKAGGKSNNIKKRFKQIDILGNVVKEFQNNGYPNVVVMGDFNSTEYILKGKFYKNFQKSVQNMNMLDSTKDMKCSAYWWGGTQDFRQYPSFLDHILVSKNLLKKGKAKVEQYGHCKKLKCESTFEDEMGISFDEVSDHCPIVTEIK